MRFILFSVSLKFSVFCLFFSVPNLFPFCSTLNCPRPSLWISVSQTPLQFSRCYDKPWLVNSKAGTPVRDSHCPNLRLPSPEVEYGFAEWGRGPDETLAYARPCPALLPDTSPSVFCLWCLLAQLIR